MTSGSHRRYGIALALWLAVAPNAANAKLPQIASVEQRIVTATGEFRHAQGRGKLTAEARLTKTAREFAHYMAQSGKYGHGADGRRPEDRAAEQGYDYCIVAENIAYLFSPKPFGADELGRKFVHGWENSPGHRRNMLNPDVTQIGVGVARSEKTGYYYAVQLFGRPKSDAVTFKIANAAGAAVTYTLGGQSLSLAPGVTRTHQQCGATPLAVAGTTLYPKNGERYTLTREASGKIRVQKANAAAQERAP
jgi:uncharacterized protein YkwD